jgi:hypothetical protein
MLEDTLLLARPCAAFLIAMRIFPHLVICACLFLVSQRRFSASGRALLLEVIEFRTLP